MQSNEFGTKEQKIAPRIKLNHNISTNIRQCRCGVVFKRVHARLRETREFTLDYVKHAHFTVLVSVHAFASVGEFPLRVKPLLNNSSINQVHVLRI